jgi:hypothetical protein
LIKLAHMKFTFKAKIYKVGINPCVDVPLRITTKMKRNRGYIRVRGKIESFDFLQTLVPVKNSDYRLYVNGPMMKGANVSVGHTASFVLEQDLDENSRAVPMRKEFRVRLKEENLDAEFRKLTPSRQKEVLRYLANLKSEEALMRNIEKVIRVMKGQETSAMFRVK